MKNKTNRRITITLLALCVLLLVGFGKKTVELLNNTLLIDLDKAIVLSSVGTEGNRDADSDLEETDEGSVAPVKTQVLVITIRDTQIKYGRTVVADASKLKELLVNDIKTGDSVRLVDDYAEAHVYRDVLGLLDELSGNIGFTYSEY